MENNKELKQAKKRTEKIYITDIAIQKVPKGLLDIPFLTKGL